MNTYQLLLQITLPIIMVLLNLRYVDQLNLADGSVRKIVPFHQSDEYLVISTRDPLWTRRSEDSWINSGGKWVYPNFRPITLAPRDRIISQVAKFNNSLEQLRLNRKEHEDVLFDFAVICDSRGGGVRFHIDDNTVWVKNGDGEKLFLWPQ